MKRLALLFLSLVASAFAAPERMAATDAAKLVAEGKAVLVDIREPAEWNQTGVAAPAVLLPKSDFDGEQKRWKDFLASVGDKQVILYCASGRRADAVSAKLAELGHKTANVGGFKDWAAAGLPTRKADEPAK